MPTAIPIDIVCVYIYIYMHDMLASLLTLLMDTYKALSEGETPGMAGSEV